MGPFFFTASSEKDKNNYYMAKKDEKIFGGVVYWIKHPKNGNRENQRRKENDKA